MARCRAPPAGVPSRLLHASQRLGLALLLTLISVTLTKDKRQELPDRDAGAADGAADRAGSVGQEVGGCVCVSELRGPANRDAQDGACQGRAAGPATFARLHVHGPVMSSAELRR